ncbi:MAG: MBL fold metallo-hydrolase RNA specificity domain-containing protein, partial [Dehalococcoidia bacterium]
QPEFKSGDELLHASGHASGPELMQLVREISPQTLIPIHTENPRYFVEALAGEPIEVRVPEYGKALTIE